MRSEAVVVEIKVLEGDMGGQECDKRGLCVQTESIVIQIDCIELWEVED